MDVHKPNPWHGWREFLKEYGIIVLGVLTALAFEQLASALKDVHDADEARANIRDELATNFASLSERGAIQACMNRRLDELRTVIEASGKPAYVRPLWIGRPQHWPMFQAKWNAALNAGHAALLTSKQQADFGQLYYTLGMLQDAENAEQAAWARLRVLTETDHISPQLQGDLFTALSQARLANWQIRLFLVRSQGLAKPLGLPRPAPQHTGSRSVCVPMNTPRAEALLRSGVPDTIGEP